MNKPTRPEWLLLMFELPASLSNLRVKIWRRLQKIGAINLKNSVYVLPKSPETEEDFDWLRQTIQDGGGQVFLMTARAGSAPDDQGIIRQFQDARAQDYKELRTGLARIKKDLASQPRELSANKFGDALEALRTEQERLADILKRDFFPTRLGDEVKREVESMQLELKSKAGAPPKSKTDFAGRKDPKDYAGKLWVTRRGMHVDRLGCAWLILNHIDPKARFQFVDGKHAKSAPVSSHPFDMIGAEFGHHGDDCSFETLLKCFDLRKDKALVSLSEIVHDVDIKDGKFNRPEAPGLDLFVRSLREGCKDDKELLKEGAHFFSTLYSGLKTAS